MYGWMDCDWICKMDTVMEYLAFDLIAHLEYMIYNIVVFDMLGG